MLIDSSHQPEARRAFATVSVLTVLLLLLGGILASTTSPRVPYFLPMHTALETLSLIVSVSIFGVVWTLRRESLSRNIILLASVFLGVALLDFSHMLSYAGMPEFVTPSSPEKSIYFWLAGSLFSAAALVAVAVLPWVKRGSLRGFRLQLLLVLTAVAALYIVYFGYGEWVPRSFVAGHGLTSFKVTFEYVLIILNLLAAALFAWRMRQPRRFDASGLFAAACAMAQSEVFVTLYVEVADVYNLLGHIYKLLAYVFLFRAVFVETVSHPYAQLRESQRRLQATLDALPDLVFEMDAQGHYLGVYASHQAGLLMSRDQLPGLRMQDIMPAAASATIMTAFAQARSSGSSRGKVIELLIKGKPRWFELSVVCRPVDAGQEECFIVISRDITDRLDSEQSLRTLSLAIEQSPIAFVVADAQYRITMTNESYTRITGYTERELLGHRLFDVFDTHTLEASRQSMLEQLAEGKSWQGKLAYLSKDDRERALSVLIYPVRNRDGEFANYIAHLEDITEKERSAQRIRQLSFYDQMTGLPNQAQLQEHFRYVSQKASSVAMLWINLDHFKDVNDSLGRQVGDDLLLEMSRRLHRGLRTQDFLSRLSGDNFLAVLPDISPEDVAALAQSLLEVASRPLQLSSQAISLTASIGIALYPNGADQFETLVGHAEAAMYQAKGGGRNASCFFAPEVQAHAIRMLTLGNALKQALHKGELHLVYQPQLHLSAQRFSGAEALLRWDSPEWGCISPTEFIPLAEATGMIISIGEWVLQAALQQARDWRDHGLSDLMVAVNLSAEQFNLPDLPDRISRILEQVGMPVECLTLELTERVAMQAPETAAQRIHELRRRGICVAIDDFGTGYSSLSYLKQFKVDKIKIDESFVRDIESDPDDQAIVSAIIQMAQSLGISTIAEGVETAGQMAFLQARGCDDIQGYYFSKPLDPIAFEHFVQQHRSESRP